MRIATTILMVLLAAGHGWLEGQTGPGNAGSAPDLSLLRERVETFWSLLQKKDRDSALQYVEADRRDQFSNWKTFDFSSFELKAFDFEKENGTEVRVRARIEVTGAAAFSGRTFEWPVDQVWSWSDDTWSVRIEVVSPREAFRSVSSIPTAPSVDDSEIGAQEVQYILREFKKISIPRSHMGIGTIPAGEIPWRELPYQNGAEIPISMEVLEAPRWVVMDRTHFEMSPGEKGNLQFGLVTDGLEGKISGSVLVSLSHGPVTHKRKITVQATVESPLVVLPGALILGEMLNYEVSVKNRTKQAIRLTGVRSDQAFLEIEGVGNEGVLIPPGEATTLPMRWHPDQVPADWVAGHIELLVDKPVGGQSSVKIPVFKKIP